MEATTQNRKSAELDWFEFETRMRKLVVDLIQPTVTKLNEDRENVAGIKAIAEAQRKRVDELEAIVMHKSGSHQSHFDTIYQKFNEIVM